MKRPLEALRRGVQSLDPYLSQTGELLDPVFGCPAQYGTAYFAFCQAVLAMHSGLDERDERIDKALRGVEAALDHIADPDATPNLSSTSRDTATCHYTSHRDFFWPAILSTYRIMKALRPDAASALAERIRAIDVLRSFQSRPPWNWASVWVAGEAMRIREGLSPFSPETYAEWVAGFEAEILVEQGFYCEPGLSNAYDLFTRVHLAMVLVEGMGGKATPMLERLMETGIRRSLAVQLSDGSLASGHRSTGQTWTLGAQCAYFTIAARWADAHGSGLANECRHAAGRALSSFVRWQRPEGPFSPVENVLPPSWRVGYETYSLDASYSALALGFLARAILDGFEETPMQTEQPRSLLIEHDPVHRVVARRGRFAVAANGAPAEGYDGFGLVDLTLGSGRAFHWASSVRHLSSPQMLLNLGIAMRREPGLCAFTFLSDGREIPPSAIRETENGFAFTARRKGEGVTYALEVSIGEQEVLVSEEARNHRGWLTFLAPYLRDNGSGIETQVTITRGAESTVLRFAHGEEVVDLTVESPAENVIHLPYGYENRRGLCGLIRVDLAGERSGVRYRVSVVR